MGGDDFLTCRQLRPHPRPSPTRLRLFSGPPANTAFLYQIYFKNQTPARGVSHPAHLLLPDVLSIVIDSFTSATERHIEVCFYSMDG